MGVEIQLAEVRLNNNTVAFTFSDTIQYYTVALANFNMQFPDNDDNDLENFSISVVENSRVGATVTLQVNMDMHDNSGHTPDAANTLADLVVIAFTGAGYSALTLNRAKSVTNSSNSEITLSGTNPSVSLAALCGVNVAYASGEHHHVQTLAASASANFTNNPAVLSGSVTMNDASGNNGSGSVDVTVIADSDYTPLIAVKQLGPQQNQSTTVTFDQPMAAAVAVIQSYQIQFPNNDDHKIRRVYAGYKATGQSNLSSDGLTYTITDAIAGMVDDDTDNTQDNNNSWVTLAVLAVPRNSSAS